VEAVAAQVGLHQLLHGTRVELTAAAVVLAVEHLLLLKILEQISAAQVSLLLDIQTHLQIPL
jgi:hypothetical protein